MPANRLELRRFINSMGFFRNSIPHYAELSCELIDLVTRSDPTKKGHVKFGTNLKNQSFWKNSNFCEFMDLPFLVLCRFGHEIDYTL